MRSPIAEPQVLMSGGQIDLVAYWESLSTDTGIAIAMIRQAFDGTR